METYWNIISRKHQTRLCLIAKNKGIKTDTAMRNIINYIKNNSPNLIRPDYFKDFITGRQIESVIDTLVSRRERA